ncbi:M1 family metallopeptidase [Mucilaginibacter sp. 21P]|uniref:M1 family metallopeptidase n=1 Tax=Mucilaginibacter sp. 21P TaxID=2778902 RepID=UPI001C597F20|nr:M1 family metallopeptidase [Mucilaginibacter sp. 21P]QXV63901.1 M1 family metallopeptidase [Mucilaginibacter sp. 21P]
MKNIRFFRKPLAVMFVLSFTKLAIACGNPADNLNTAPAELTSTLVDTKLEVKFDFQKHYLIGAEWITLKALRRTDSAFIDAKGMDIVSVMLLKANKKLTLQYKYDGSKIRIALGKKLALNELYRLHIKYVAKPDELKLPQQRRISETKGLYFINTRGEEKNTPVEIWTQGEPEASSIWFPTIDRPDQKTTAQISITVPARYTTLSNGALISKVAAPGNMRTDTWKMSKPHSPYLFMMAVGEFDVYREKDTKPEISYYMEKKYSPYARSLFSKTPEMIAYYSKVLGVPFPWNKYSQVVVRNYTSGAMENTTATLIGEFAQKTSAEIKDEGYDDRESTIAHELFHQWFGDLVTCKDWNNVTVNESLATWAESLWAEHKYGRECGEAELFKDSKIYLGGDNVTKKALVRTSYKNSQEVFDEVSYQKGACVLAMLRNYLTDKIFFKGLNIYLLKHAYNSASALDLQRAFEQASAQKLDWFFNQWYNRPGHPVLDITYKWDQAAKKQKVILKQTQEGEAFKFPLHVDVYLNKQRKRFNLWMNSKADSLEFNLAAEPELVNVDGDRVLLADLNDHKTLKQYIAQYNEGIKLADRADAIDKLSAMQDSTGAKELMLSALTDRNAELRAMVIMKLDLTKTLLKPEAEVALRNVILHDNTPFVKAGAIRKISSLKDKANYAVFVKALNSNSYAIKGAALLALADLDPARAIKLAKPLEADNKGELTMAIVRTYFSYGNEEQLEFVTKVFDESSLDTRFDIAKGCTILLSRVNNSSLVFSNIDKIKLLAIEFKKFGVDKYAIKWLDELIRKKQIMADSEKGLVKEQLIAQINFINKSIDEVRSAKADN